MDGGCCGYGVLHIPVSVPHCALKCYWCVTGSNDTYLVMILHESKLQLKISFYNSDQFYFIFEVFIAQLLGLFILQNMGGAGL